ncbi:MAG: LytR C-terminal domain-containing protein [Acidimicrobiales bacterium]
MDNTAGKGAVLIVLALLVGAFVLGRGFDGGGSDGSLLTGDSTSGDASAVDDASADADENGDAVAVDPADSPGTETLPLTTPSHAPDTVKVLVANGGTVTGAASVATGTLAARNYVMLDATNSPENAETTTVYYEPEYQPDADAIAQILSVGPTAVQPMPATEPGPSGVDTRGAHVLVVLGNDPVAEGTDG